MVTATVMATSSRPPRKPKPAWALAIEVRRTTLQLSQEIVAERAEMSQSYYSDVERGDKPLHSLTVGKLLGLASALNWTLAEMQRATGVNLGIVETETTGQDATPIYKLQDLAQDTRQPDAWAFVAPNPRVQTPPNALAVFADSNEMTSDQQRSIHEGDIVFLDLSDTTADRPNNIYAVEHQGKVHLRRLTPLPSGLAFTADHSTFALNFIPADQARVLGRAYRIVSDQLPSSPNRLSN